MDYSQKLMLPEYHAMRLVTSDQELADPDCPPEIRNYVLTGAELAASPEERRKMATELVFGPEYSAYKEKIYDSTDRTLEEAKEFLRELSGQTHVVFTGVAYDGDVKVATSNVTFRRLSDSAIDYYVAKVRPTDRAGAYDIDESGDLIVERWTGSYENIMGLPVEPLREWGIVK